MSRRKEGLFMSRKKESKTKTPSKARYDANHPGICVRLPLEDFNKLNEILKQSQLTKSEALKMWVNQQIGNITKFEEVKRESYSNGFDDGQADGRVNGYNDGVKVGYKLCQQNFSKSANSNRPVKVNPSIVENSQVKKDCPALTKAVKEPEYLEKLGRLLREQGKTSINS